MRRNELLFIAFVVFVMIVLSITAAHAQALQTTLSWTAPGDDGTVGTATSYEGRWSSVRPDTASATNMLAWWNASSLIAMPVPAVAGTPQSVTVAPAGGFAADVTYYFVIRAVDDAGNRGAYSNVAWRLWGDVAPPAAIRDLR